MTIKTEMVGQTFGPFVRDYEVKDSILFALGCGCAADGKTDLEYAYEKNQKILPMFGAMLIVDSEVTKTIDYGYNYAGSLHWGFDLRFHRPLTRASGRLSTKVLLKGLYDRGEGKGLLAQHVGDTYDEEGNLLFTNESWDCLIYDGGWGDRRRRGTRSTCLRVSRISRWWSGFLRIRRSSIAFLATGTRSTWTGSTRLRTGCHGPFFTR